ncbi:MAG: hypothetical protein EBS05_15895 [Proteobacteria bacterium]|nr:hypothetical protein [Pseudomonadota bacterium]
MTAVKRPAKPKRVALVTTIVRKFSHGQHFVDRLLEGYGWHGEHHTSPLDLVSLYVEQFPETDSSHERCARHGVKLCPTIAEALTLGTSRLAVDGVLIVGEHGDYPRDAKGQPLYPRFRFFKDVVKTFERTNQSVPVFQDKHFAMDWREAQETYRDAQRLGFPLMAGSSLPVTWRLPAIEIPLGTPLVESVGVGYGHHGYYDIHTIETAQSMSERRAGGEAGVKSVQAYKNDAVWRLLEERPTTRRLCLAALNRSQTLAPAPGYTFAEPSVEHLKRVSPFAVAYVFEHLDGFRTTIFHFNGTGTAFSRDTAALNDFSYAGLTQSGEVFSTLMYLPMPPTMSTLASFFSPLVNHIEHMVLTGRPSWPIERNYLTTGMTLFAVDSLYANGAKLDTPDLRIRYQPTPGPHFWLE